MFPVGSEADGDHGFDDSIDCAVPVMDVVWLA